MTENHELPKTYAPGDIIKGDYMDIIPYIVEAEMGGGFNTEALKAQAVAARTYALKKIKADGDYDVVDNTNDQVYYGFNAANTEALLKAALKQLAFL